MNLKLDMSSHVTDVLKRQVDDLQQYSHRYTIMLENVPATRNEKNDEVEAEVKTILTTDFKVDATELANEFDKAHRGESPWGQQNPNNYCYHSFRWKLYVRRNEYQQKRENK